MAVPPTIPTSFVPKQPVAMHPRYAESGGNMFLTVAFAIAGIALVASAAVFGYKTYLAGQRDQKSADLKAAQASVSPETVDGFIRLRNRLTAAQDLMNQHVMTSQFFDVLEGITLQQVSFGSFNLQLQDDRSALIEVSGKASTFNALAAQSAAFAAEPRIRRAIFSDIGVDDKGIVSFSLTATVDPRLIEMPSTVPATWLGSTTQTQP